MGLTPPLAAAGHRGAVPAECPVQERLLPARQRAEPGTVRAQGGRAPGLLPEGRCLSNVLCPQPVPVGHPPKVRGPGWPLYRAPVPAEPLWGLLQVSLRERLDLRRRQEHRGLHHQQRLRHLQGQERRGAVKDVSPPGTPRTNLVWSGGSSKKHFCCRKPAFSLHVSWHGAGAAGPEGPGKAAGRQLCVWRVKRGIDQRCGRTISRGHSEKGCRGQQ